MIRLLIAIGRIAIVLSAIGLIITGCIYGFICGRMVDFYFYQNYVAAGRISPNEFIFALLGAIVGLIVAGNVFGLFAAIFDIHRILAKQQP